MTLGYRASLGKVILKYQDLLTVMHISS